MNVVLKAIQMSDAEVARKPAMDVASEAPSKLRVMIYEVAG
jgi:hypothetical protein